jgi:hypothetical protein
MAQQHTSTAPHLLQMQIHTIVFGSQSSPEGEVPQNTSDVQGLQTPEHVTWLPDSTETPWSQQTERRVVVPLKLDLEQLLGEYYPTGKGLFYLIIL